MYGYLTLPDQRRPSPVRRRSRTLLAASTWQKMFGQSGQFDALTSVLGVVHTMIREVSDATTNDFDVFYRREFAAIAVVAGATVGDRSAGEDIAQEAFSRASERWSTVSTYDKPGAWVRRVAINLALSRRRRLANEAKALRRVGRAEEVSTQRQGDPEIWNAVDQLPPRQRAVVALHYLDDLAVADIAEILEISVSATTSHLHKARQNLARILGEGSSA